MTGKWRARFGGKEQDGSRLLERLPPERRLDLMTSIVIIPLAMSVIYLMATVAKFCDTYTRGITNITQANSVTANLRKDVDYSMYRIVMGMRTYRSIRELMEEDRSYGWEQIKDPHRTISDARKTYCQLLKRTPEGTNRTRINRLMHCLDQLEQRVNEIEGSLPHGMYDKNMETLNCGVRVLIIDVEKQGREYVYYETLHVQEIQKELESQKHTAVMVSLTLLVSILLISLLLSRRMTENATVPIQKLYNETEKVAKEDFISGPKIEARDELATPMGSFDHMEEETGRPIEDMRQEQSQCRVTELQLLQKQINPRFFYNALGTTVRLAEGGQNRVVVDMIIPLSEFFRITLSGGKDFITIREGIGHTKSYLQIQRVRYQDIMDYEVTLEKSLKECRILKLTLQPLVESALYHGIENKRGEGHVLIRGYAKEDMAMLEAKDDGVGMTEKEMKAVRRKLRGEKDSSLREESAPKGGSGLFSAVEYLRLDYGSRCGLEFGSVLGLDTRVVMTIPLEFGYGGEGED